MAKFEPYGIDDISPALSILEMECPICQKEISFSLDDIGSKITCPHCKTEIELTSE